MSTQEHDRCEGSARITTLRARRKHSFTLQYVTQSTVNYLSGMYRQTLPVGLRTSDQLPMCRRRRQPHHAAQQLI
jgi:hypothetical protein